MSKNGCVLELRVLDYVSCVVQPSNGMKGCSLIQLQLQCLIAFKASCQDKWQLAMAAWQPILGFWKGLVLEPGKLPG